MELKVFLKYHYVYSPYVYSLYISYEQENFLNIQDLFNLFIIISFFLSNFMIVWML